jgi:tripartite-type tricarboxylate transporter receptor subunit TctC
MPRIVNLAVCAALLTISTAARAQQSAPVDQKVADFYRGNTVYMAIGSAPGPSAFDYYGRVVGKYMARYIPGNPTVVPQNIPGAGGYNAAAKVAINSPQDGTYIGGIHPTVIVDPILGDPSKGAKELKFAFLGNAAENLEACFLRTDAPAKSFADAFHTEIVLGASSTASSTREYPALLKSVLGMKIKIVAGYGGNADIPLAGHRLRRGRAQAPCHAHVAVDALRPPAARELEARLHIDRAGVGARRRALVVVHQAVRRLSRPHCGRPRHDRHAGRPEDAIRRRAAAVG